MKNQLTLLLAFIITTTCWGQAPEKMSYQSVIRNSSNNLVKNTSVSTKISILQGSTTGTIVYSEIQTANTNANGLLSLSIGDGIAITGTFTSINWSAGTFFIKTETDPAGGTNYTITGITQLLSVPYALYAKSSGSSTPGPKGDQGIQGATGITGATGAAGVGVPVGGTTGQVLSKINASNYNTQWVTPTSGAGASVELMATITTAQTISINTVTDVVYNNVLTNPSISNASYNSTTGVYTVGDGGGIFIVSAQLIPNSQNNLGIIIVAGTTKYYGTLTSNNQYVAPLARASATTVVSLNKGDTIKIVVSSNNNSPVLTSESTFTIVKL